MVLALLLTLALVAPLPDLAIGSSVTDPSDIQEPVFLQHWEVVGSDYRGLYGLDAAEADGECENETDGE